MWSSTLSRPVSGRSRFLTSVALPITVGLIAAVVPEAVRAQQVIDGPPPVVKSVNEVIAGGLTVGDTLPGTELTIDSAAVIDSQGLTVVGMQAGSAGILTIQDGAALNVTNEFYAGFFGDGELIIASGGQLTNTGSGIAGLGASTATATVTGAGSVWTSTGTLSVGFQGQGTLLVEDGGAVISTNGYVGHQATSTSTATITGAGSSWSASDSLFIGYSGNGALTIADGASLSSVTDSWIGFFAGATGLVTVTGAGSTWTNSAALITGYNTDGELRIEDGGVVTNTTGYLGSAAVGTGLATVTGAGSTWTNVDTLFVGQAGQGTLTVADGGTVAVTGILGALEVGYLIGSTGLVNVGAAAGSAAAGAGDIDAAFVRFGQGSGSLVFNHTDTDHEFDAAIVGTGTVSHHSGETILTSASHGWAGETNVHGGALIIEGATNNAGQDIYVGRLLDDDGFLAIQNGGTLSLGRGVIGAELGSVGEAEVIGTGSSWSMTGAFVVGDAGAGLLTIADSGQLEAGDAVIGGQGDSTGDVLVTGAGSTWDSTSLVVGLFGQGLLAIEDGAVVTTGVTAIGLEADSIGEVYLTGSATTWNAASMTLGDEGAGLMVLANGATLSLDGGAGTLLLAADSGSFAALLIGEDCGCGPEGPGVLDAAQVVFGAGDGGIVFAHDTTGYVFDADISGFGQIALLEGGTVFTGDSSGFTGFTQVGAALGVASLTVSGILGGDVGVSEDGTLTGGGSILGHVDVGFGALANAAGTTLTMGSLDLDAGSLVQVTLGAAGSPALFDVVGDLVLDGELTVTDAGGFGPGIYRLFDYGGTLTDNGLDIADLPAGQNLADWSVQVSVANQINLVGAIDPGDLLFWDGADGGLHDNSAVNGGDGVWDAVNVNWTEMTGAVNGAMSPQPGFAIFMATAGEVTVDDSVGAIGVTGMQFAVDGYVISGDSIELTESETTIRVGDGTEDGADMVATIASSLTGAAHLVKRDLGTLILTGVNTYTDGTSVDYGTLAVEGQIAGDVAVAEDGTLTGGGTVLGHVEIGEGTLANAAGATLTMGSLTLEAASRVDVALGAAGSPALFDVTGDLVLDGELTVTDAGGFGPGIYRLFDYGETLTDNGLDIADLPAGQNLADWSVQVSVANQINLVTAIGPGDLLFWDGTDAGLHDNGAVNGGDGVWDAVNVNWTEMTGAVNGAMSPQPGFAVFSGVAGNVTVDDGAGAIEVTGMQFAIDGYAISGDSISLTEAESVIRVGDGTADGADMIATIASDLTGSGGLVKTDLGTLVLTGTNTYGGGTFVEGGVLVGDVDSLVGDIDNEARVVFDQDAAGVYGDVWSGDGRFEVEGAGLTLAGDSSGFTGETLVTDGLLVVDGELGGLLGVGALGRLEGAGSVGSLLVGSGGVVAPGDGVATLTVTGDVTFEAGSVYEVETDPTNGLSDLIHASGTAEINGGTVAHVGVDGDYEAFSTYTILTADGGVDGTFDDLTTDFAFLAPELTYDANNVYLTLVRNDVSFGGVAQSPNQAAVGGAVQVLGYGNALWNAVVKLSAGGAQAAFDDLSGEAHATTRTGLIADSARLRQALGARLYRDPTAEGVDLWAEAYGMTAHTDDDGNAGALEHDGRGLFIGLDRAVGSWRLGLAAGGGQADLTVASRGSSAETESLHLGLYGDTRHGQARLSFGAARSWHEIDTERTVVVGAFADAPQAAYDAESTQAFVELAWRVGPGDGGPEAFAGVAHVSLETDEFLEAGGAAALTSFGGSDSVTFTSLGLRDSHVTEGGMILHGSAAWRHAEGDIRPESRVSLAGAATSFEVLGAPIGEDVLALDIGVDAPLSTDFTLGFAYSGQLGEGVTDHTLRGSVSWRF